MLHRHDTVLGQKLFHATYHLSQRCWPATPWLHKSEGCKHALQTSFKSWIYKRSSQTGLESFLSVRRVKWDLWRIWCCMFEDLSALLFWAWTKELRCNIFLLGKYKKAPLETIGSVSEPKQQLLPDVGQHLIYQEICKSSLLGRCKQLAFISCSPAVRDWFTS